MIMLSPGNIPCGLRTFHVVLFQWVFGSNDPQIPILDRIDHDFDGLIDHHHSKMVNL